MAKVKPKSKGVKKPVRKTSPKVKKTVKPALKKHAAKNMISAKKKSSAKKTAVKKAVVKKAAVKKAVVKKAAVRKVVRKITAVDSKPVIKKVAEKKVPTVAVKSEPVVVPKLKRYKPNKKTKYSKAELKHFREIILQERKAIFESAKANMDALVDKDGEYKGDNLTYSSHMAEQGTDEMEREKNYLFVQRDEKYLGYLQDALMRIDQGTYGICIDCKDDPKNLCRTCPLIVKERLELVPITQHCIECKNLRG